MSRPFSARRMARENTRALPSPQSPLHLPWAGSRHWTRSGGRVVFDHRWNMSVSEWRVLHRMPLECRLVSSSTSARNSYLRKHSSDSGATSYSLCHAACHVELFSYRVGCFVHTFPVTPAWQLERGNAAPALFLHGMGKFRTFCLQLFIVISMLSHIR